MFSGVYVSPSGNTYACMKFLELKDTPSIGTATVLTPVSYASVLDNLLNLNKSKSRFILARPSVFCPALSPGTYL